MVYNPTHPHWASGVAGGTLVSAVALNEMDAGILDASNRIDTLTSTVSTNTQNISSLSSQVAQIQTAINNGTTGGSGGAVSSVAGRTGTVVLTKSDVGLSNVDNTSDVNKPISTAVQSALNAKAPIASPTFTGTVSGITAAMVGLGNVDNTSDVNKPISTATQSALNTKANLNSPTFTGTVSGITKSMVGLSNVDNTSDVSKFNTWGQYPVIHYTGTAWPTRTLPSGYTGPVIWESELYSNVSAPSAAVDTDRWSRKRVGT